MVYDICRPAYFINLYGNSLFTTCYLWPYEGKSYTIYTFFTISTVIGDRPTGYRVTVVYGRPYTKDPGTGATRKIWGGLVPWGEAYRLGADEASILINEKAIVMQGTTIPAGAHTLYMVPSETGTSKLAISTDVGGWGVPVDETNDLARVDLKRDALEKQVDQLTMAIVS